MKIAVLHWHTSSVGGINTTLEAYRAVADKRGDTFHVFASDNQRTKKPMLFDSGVGNVRLSRKRVRGGDSFIWIDGYAPHHKDNYAASAEMLRDYDVIMTSFLCPHPTKAYGDQPVFLQLLGSLNRPLIGYIHDAYWETYESFGRLVLPNLSKLMICQKAYAGPFQHTGLIAYPPFFPFVAPKKIERDYESVVWTPQWKNIKGVHKFFEGLPRLGKRRIDLYNNGIEYYKLRLTPEWKKSIGFDLFAPDFAGERGATFHGCVPLKEVMWALMEGGFSIDFQGHGSKYKAYLNGSYNHTLSEAMYYGAVPVVHDNALKSGIPPEFVLPVGDLRYYPEAIGGYDSRGYPRKKAKQYVMDNFDAERQYGRIFDDYRTAR